MNSFRFAYDDIATSDVLIPDMVLMYNPNGVWRVAAGQQTKHLLNSSVVAGRQPKTQQRVEPGRVWPLVFHLVQVPGVHFGALDRVKPERDARRWNFLSMPSNMKRITTIKPSSKMLLLK